MKLALASDMHLEFYRDGQALPPIPGINQTNPPDILVLAGDIAVGHAAIIQVKYFAEQLPNTQIIFVAGNHEHYYGDYFGTLTRFRDAFKDSGQIHFLERESVTINGWRFLGCTLWTGFDGLTVFPYPIAMDAARSCIADFRLIGNDGNRWQPGDAQEEYAVSAAWLDLELNHHPTEKTIVVTHFPPATCLNHPRFPDDALTPYFTGNLESLIEKHSPRYWLYGHNHWSARTTLGKTELISNQLGYPREAAQEQGFTLEHILDLD